MTTRGLITTAIVAVALVVAGIASAASSASQRPDDRPGAHGPGALAPTQAQRGSPDVFMRAVLARRREIAYPDVFARAVRNAQSTASPAQAATSESTVAWRDVSIGAAGGFLFAAILAGAAVTVRSRRHGGAVPRGLTTG